MRVFNNDNCFFMKAIDSIGYHSNHTFRSYEEITLGSSKMSTKMSIDRSTMGFATSSSSSMAMGMYKMHKHTVTKQAMANCSVKDKISFHSDIDKSKLREVNDAEGVRDVLHEHGCRVLILQLMGSTSQCSVPKVTYDVSEPDVDSTSGNIDYDEKGVDEKGVSSWVQQTKSSLSKQHKDLICIAWITKDMKRLANAFSQSLSIDATHKTVKIDGLSHLTVTVKDSFGKTTVVTRLWIPNQKEWMFKYVLNVVIPKLLGDTYCSRVKAICTDGDQVLIRMVNLAINTIYTNAVRLPCAWHLIDRPMVAARARFAPKSHVSLYFIEWFCRLLRGWLFTWMRPSGGIYSKDEYQVSKALLLAFMDSDALTKYFSSSGIIAMKEYVLGVLKTEHEYVAYKYLELFALEMYTNCGHEGTNRGVKYNSEGVKPNSSLGTSSNSMANYDKQVFVERKKTCMDDFNKKKTWTVKFNNLTTHAAAILCDQEEKTKLVVSSEWDPDKSLFYVLCPNDIHRHSSLARTNLKEKAKETLAKLKPTHRSQKKQKTLAALKSLSMYEIIENMSNDEKDATKSGSLAIPEFNSAFQVGLRFNDGHWYLCCSCHFGKRFGGPCVHEFHVYDSYLKKLNVQEWDYRNVSIAHWSMYSYLYMKNPTEMNANELEQFQKLKQIDPSVRFGTLVKIDGYDNPGLINWSNLLSTCEGYETRLGKDIVSPKQWSSLPAVDRVTNYTEKEAKDSMESHGDVASSAMNSSKYEMTLSQKDDNDGYEDFGILWGEDSLLGADSGASGGAASSSFNSRLESSASNIIPDNREARKSNLRKEFHTLLNTVDCRDTVLYSAVLNSLTQITTNARKYNEDTKGIVEKDDDGKCYFPNSSFGDNSRDMVTRGEK